MDYKLKYFKYKQKYLNLLNSLPGPLPQIPGSFIQEKNDDDKIRLINTGQGDQISKAERFFSNYYTPEDIKKLWEMYPFTREFIFSNISLSGQLSLPEFIKSYFDSSLVADTKANVKIFDPLIKGLYNNTKKLKIDIELPIKKKEQSLWESFRSTPLTLGGNTTEHYHLVDIHLKTFLPKFSNLEELYYSSSIEELNNANSALAKLKKLVLTISSPGVSLKKGNFPELEILELHNMIINDNIYSDFLKSSFPKLKKLTINNNIPSKLNFDNLQTLEELCLGLSFNLSHEDLMNILKKLTKLTKLSLPSTYSIITSPRPNLTIQYI